MSTNKLGTVLVESIGDEERNIVFPLITRCGGQHDPLIVLGHLNKRLCPSAVTHHPLLVKNKECTLDIDVLMDVVVGLDGQFDVVDRQLRISTYV